MMSVKGRKKIALLVAAVILLALGAGLYAGDYYRAEVVEAFPASVSVEITGTKAVFALLEQTARPAGVDARQKLLEVLDRLLKDVPVWKLRCNMEEDAVLVSYEAMRGKE